MVDDPSPGDTDPAMSCPVSGDIMSVVRLYLPCHDKQVSMLQINVHLLLGLVNWKEAERSVTSHRERQYKYRVSLVAEKYFVISMGREAAVESCIEVQLAAGGKVFRSFGRKMRLQRGVCIHDEVWHGQRREMITSIGVTAFARSSNYPGDGVLAASDLPWVAICLQSMLVPPHVCVNAVHKRRGDLLQILTSVDRYSGVITARALRVVVPAFILRV